MFDPNPVFGSWTILAALRGLTLMFVVIALVELKPWRWRPHSFNYGLAVVSLTLASVGLSAGLSSSMLIKEQRIQPSIFLIDVGLIVAAVCWSRLFGVKRNELGTKRHEL